MATHDVQIFNVSADEPGGTDVTAQIAGAQAASTASAVSAQQASNNIDVNVFGATASGGAGQPTVQGTITENLPNYPLVGSIIYDREWVEDNANGVNWRAEMAKLDVLVIGLFPKGVWDNASPPGLSRQEGYNDLIARNGQIYLFDYTSVMEASISQAVQAELIDWINATTAFSGGVPGDWSANNFWARDAGGNIINTFKADPNVLNVNITQFPDLTDAQGRQYPQRYGDYILEYMFDPVNTNKNGGPGSVGIFHDVMDQRTKTSNYDGNADGSADGDPQGNWNDPTDPDGVETARQWRQGHRNYEDHLRINYPGMYSFGNWTLHLNGAFGVERYDSTDMSVLPFIHNEYYQVCNGAYIENNTKGDFPESGLKADGTTGGSGNWQRVYNRYVQCMLSTAAPNLAMMDWAAELTPHLGPNPSGFNPTGGPFHVLRWGLGTCLMDNGVFHPHFSQSTFRTIAFIDELGITNTGTTGLSKGWLGRPLDDPQRAPRQGSNIWIREFENGLVVLNTGNNILGSVTVVQISNIPGGAGTFKRINGLQAPAVNDNSVVNANFSLNQADALILQRV